MRRHPIYMRLKAIKAQIVPLRLDPIIYDPEMLGRIKGGNWRIKGGNWRIKGGNWRIKGGNWRIKGGNWRI